ncbi:hypothetical protein [Pseudosulfitobacter koreensis]|uniref:Uncharacterized protein n=1 Tax=Pseudosulfitobacter koreensis TaxID=2968472 RepID=A0ABT1Z3D4_9RHOB|nr:hypothetical protein [Pseudosulfitobacter koreense]MCR8827620.1 hypothetical protein [Pseudosulfitobacter koreense]
MLTKMIYTPDGDAGNFLQVHGTDSMATLLWRSRFKDSRLTPSINAMATALYDYSKTMLKQAEVLNAKGYKTKAETEAANLAAPWNALRRSIMDEKSSLIDRSDMMLKVEGGNAEMRSEYRKWFLSLSPPELFKTLLNSKNVELLASAIESGPALIGLDDTIFERVEERYAVVKFLYGSDKKFPPAPMAIDNLAGIEPDWKTLEKNARDQWIGIVQSNDEIDASDQYLAGALTLVAASVASMTTGQVFEILKAA